MPKRKRRPPNLKRLHNYEDSHRLTRKQAAEIFHCSAATIGVHNRAGLLAYVPGSPVLVEVGDLKEYARTLANGHGRHIHRTLRIRIEDCPKYSRVDGVLSNASYETRLRRIVQVTSALRDKYSKEK